MKLTQITGPTLGGHKPKRRKYLTLKPGKRRPTKNKNFSLKKIMKRQRNTTQMKEQTRNTEVQINEEEIGKLPEKIQNNDSKDYQKYSRRNQSQII